MDYNLELQRLKEWARSLLIIQYRQARKNTQTIDVLVDLIFANNLFVKIRDLCLSVKDSIGAQLDVVAKWVGVTRTSSDLTFDHIYTALPNYSNIEDDDFDPLQGGFSSFSTFEDNDGGFLTYVAWQKAAKNTFVLGDTDLRKLIELKIIKNSINHTCKNIDDAIWAWSNQRVYTTWTTLTVTYHYSSDMALLVTKAFEKDLLPCPTGCSIILEEE